MRHCRIGHRRGSFTSDLPRPRERDARSVYGPTFHEGEGGTPDEPFARVFHGERARLPAQAARLRQERRDEEDDVDECAMRAAGVDVAEVAALYEKTPAAAWIAETRGAPRREAIVALRSPPRSARGLEDVARAPRRARRRVP